MGRQETQTISRLEKSNEYSSLKLALSYEVSLLASAKSVQIARKNEVVLASKAIDRTADPASVTLKPKRKLLKQAPNRFKVQLRVEATDAAANTATASRTIKVGY